MKKTTKLTAALLSGAMLLTGCGKGSNIDMTQTAVTVGDVDISAGIYSFYLNNYLNQMEDVEAAKEAALEGCEDNFLIVAVGHAKGVEFDEEKQKEIDDYKQQVVSSYGDEGGYEDFLKENNLTDEDIDKIISVSNYAEALQAEVDAQNTAEPTDEEKREYFKNNYRRAKHILISTDDTDDAEAEKKAQELLEKAQSGEDFDALIAENSDDPGSTANPDGYVFTDNEMVPEFQDGVDSLEAGEFTVVKSTYGYHVIERLALDETPEYFEQAYADVADRIATLIENNRFEDQIRAWAEEYGIETTENNELIDEVTKQADK